MAKQKTKSMAENIRSYTKKKRARTSKGRFVADNPNTPQNEAYVVENTIMERLKGYAKKIREIFTIRKV